MFDVFRILPLKFAEKTAAMPRFADWFKKKEYREVNLRRELTYEEEFARTDQLKNSPVFYMRRALNAREKKSR